MKFILIQKFSIFNKPCQAGWLWNNKVLWKQNFHFHIFREKLQFISFHLNRDDDVFVRKISMTALGQHFMLSAIKCEVNVYHTSTTTIHFYYKILKWFWPNQTLVIRVWIFIENHLKRKILKNGQNAIDISIIKILYIIVKIYIKDWYLIFFRTLICF